VAPERLTRTPPQFVLSRLSRSLYEDFLGEAARRGFSFVQFRDFLPGAPPLPERFILLRHDIDFAPAFSLEMARLEAERGVRSTFFVLVDGEFYDALRPEAVRQIRAIRALGHEIGLHFAVRNSVEEDPGAEVAFRLQILSAIAGEPVRAFSQHDPVNAGFVTVSLPEGHPPAVDMNQVLRDHELLYVSDSGMMWRRHTFHSALDEGRNLCLLAHPHSWLHPQDDYVAMIRDLEAQEVSALAGRFDAFVNALAGYYTRRREEGV
jgi:hypothetical protein